MLIDNLILDYNQQGYYKSFITSFDDSIKVLIDKQWKFEAILGKSCYYHKIAQYHYANSLVHLLSKDVLLGSHDFSSLSTLYSIEENRKKLSCNNIDIATYYTNYNLEFLKYNYIRKAKDYIEVQVLVTVNSNVAFTITTTGTHTIDWGNGVITTTPTHNRILEAGTYTIKIYDDLDLISSFLLGGLANNYIVTKVHLSKAMSLLSSVSFADNRLLEETVDDIIMICNYIADTNGITTGTITLNGGTSDEPSSNSYITYAVEELEDIHGWTITTN